MPTKNNPYNSHLWRKNRAWAIQNLPHQCGICGGHIDDGDISVDHILPLNMGGTHEQENLQLTHKSCNYRKQDKILKRTSWVNERWL